MRSELGTLHPRLTEELTLPNRTAVDVRKCSVPFMKWQGDAIPNIYRKPVIDFEGEPVFAEIAVIRMLEGGGWDAAWVDSYGKGFRQYMPHVEPFLGETSQLPPVLRYPAGFQKFGGAWDVVAWKDDRVIFLECKHKGNDAIRPTQVQWLQDRLAEGAIDEDFIFVEWTLPQNKPNSLDLREGRWYAYQLLGAYGNPYFSPIRVDYLRRSGRNLDIRFWNVGYAAGVQDFEKQFECDAGYRLTSRARNLLGI